MYMYICINTKNQKTKKPKTKNQKPKTKKPNHALYVNIQIILRLESYSCIYP